MKQLTICIVICAVALLTAQGQPGFVTVSDGTFKLNNKPYYFIGTNMWYGCYLGSSKIAGGRERLIRELDFLKKEGITNLRVLGASELSEFDNHLRLATQTQPGVYNEDLLEGLDFLLAEMRKRDMKAVVYLNNYWNWSGGMGQYTVWADPERAAAVPFDPQRKWEREMKLSSLFYENEEAQKIYRQCITHVVNRVNTINNITYKNDPTIMAWQLGNEPRPGLDGAHGEQYVAAFTAWIDATAAYIKSLDAQHLVSSGNEGMMGSIQNLSYYENSHASENIDYLTLHVWAKNWSWFDAARPKETIKQATQNAVDHVQLHIDLAVKMNKPLVVEEFGIDRDANQYAPGTKTTIRDAYYATIFQHLYGQARQGKPIAGANFWAWGGFGIPVENIVLPMKAENYVGDPYMEAQGLNAVFSADKSTLKIIRKYNRKLIALTKD